MPSNAAGPPLLPPVRRALLAASGLACVALGVVGIVVPGLPTTPLLLAAAYLFARSSPRLSAWLVGHRWLGPYLRAVRDERAMSRRAKVATIGLLWLTVGLSVWRLGHGGRLGVVAGCALVGVAAAVTWFVGWRLRTAPLPPADGPA